jgi:hypothetical protein
MMKNYIIATVIFLVAIITSGQSENIGIIVLSDEAITVYSQNANQMNADALSLQINDSSEETMLYDEVRLSPDGSHLLVIGSQLTENVTFSVIDTTSGTTNPVLIPSQSGSFFTGQWSPDATYLTITEFTSRDFFLVDMQSETSYKVPNGNMGGRVEWTPENSALFFRGAMDCEGCILRSALYSLDPRTLDVQLILDPNQLELDISNWMDPVFLGQFYIHNSTIFFQISELDRENARTNLYSFDIRTNQLKQMNLDSLFPENTLGITIRHMWYSEDTNRLNVLVFFDVNPGSGWGIASWHPDENPQVVYQKLFKGDSNDIQLIASSAVSPDGQQIAIAGVDSTRQTTGSMTVVDVTTGQEVWHQEFDKPVCQVEIPLDDLVVYGLTDDRCNSLSDVVKPVNTVVTYNLLTQEQSVLIDSERSVLFVTPER